MTIHNCPGCQALLDRLLEATRKMERYQEALERIDKSEIHVVVGGTSLCTQLSPEYMRAVARGALSGR